MQLAHIIRRWENHHWFVELRLNPYDKTISVNGKTFDGKMYENQPYACKFAYGKFEINDDALYTMAVRVFGVGCDAVKPFQKELREGIEQMVFEFKAREIMQYAHGVFVGYTSGKLTSLGVDMTMGVMGKMIGSPNLTDHQREVAEHDWTWRCCIPSKPLHEQRREAAEAAVDALNIDDIVDSDPWEIEGNTWVRTYYLSADPEETSTSYSITIKFKPKTAKIVYNDFVADA